MGRFFKTARANFIDDKMFTLPADLMKDAIDRTDKGIDENLEKVDAFNSLLDIENLKTDNPAVNERLKDYRNRIHDVSNKIMQSPLDYRKYRGDIASMSRNLQQELDTGLLGRAQEQHGSFNEEMTRVNDLKDVSGENKDLYKRYVQTKYNEQGGLNYEDPNTYNEISQLFETPLNTVNTDNLINTIASNFTADTTATARAGATGTGYIRTSRGTVEIRKEKDVEDYVNHSLTENGWEDQKRQEYKWKEALGELPKNPDGTDMSVEQLIEADRQSVVDAAKNKLGYKKESKSASMSGDSMYAMKWRARQEKEKVRSGDILYDKKNYQYTIGKDGKHKYDKVVVDRFEGYTTKDGKRVPGLRNKLDAFYASNDSIKNIEDLKQAFLNGNITRDVATQFGATTEDIRKFINYEHEIKYDQTPTIPGYDDMSDDQKTEVFAEQQRYLDRIVKSFDQMNANDEIDKIVVWKNGVPIEQDYATPAEFIQGSNDWFIQPTAEGVEKAVNKAPTGELLDSDGDVIVQDGKTFKSVEEATRAGAGNRISYNTKKIQQIASTNEDLFTASVEEVRVQPEFNIKKDKRVVNKKNFVLKKPVLKVDKNGNAQLVEIEFFVDESKFNKQ